MNADNILRKHEDANEMHFHDVDRKWIIEAMEEYAALKQKNVSDNFLCALSYLNRCDAQCFTCSEDQKCDEFYTSKNR